MAKVHHHRKSGRGFTLVEILIVVIILGILAAIVVPQFSSASTDARRSNVMTQLQSIRSQIALYQLQHNGTVPNLLGDWTQMTQYTDVNGGVSATADASHVYGPYLQSVPANPLASSNTASTVATDATSAPGWVYDPATGRICATGTSSNTYFNETGGTDVTDRPW